MHTEGNLNSSPEKRTYYGGNEKTEKVNRALLEYGVSPGELSEERNHRRLKFLEALEKRDILAKTGDGLVFNSHKFLNTPLRRSIDTDHSYSALEMTRLLNGVKAIKKEEISNNNSEKKSEVRPIFELPKSVDDMVSAEAEGYAERNSKALLIPWKVGRHVMKWTEPILLASGEKTNLSEMALASVILKDCQARREKDGQLTIVVPGTNKRVPFSPRLLKESAGFNPCVLEGDTTVSWHSNPYEFVHKYMPNLLAKGVLTKSDFRIMGGRRTAELYNVHDRKLNPKVPFLSVSNRDKLHAKYYIGRTNLPGTETKINPQTMKARELDADTLGILEEQDGRQKLLYTFRLLNKEELGPIREATKRRLQERGMPATELKISMNTVVGEKIMRDRIQEYSITNYLKPRPGEIPAEYYKRLRPLDNPEFVLGKVKDFFEKAGIGTHNLPWAEQLVLSRALLEKNNESRLLSFAKKYGLTGIRSFLSLDYDRKLGSKILDLGEKLEPGLAAEIFKKYGEIVDAANSASEFLHNLSGEQLSERARAELQERFLRKAKDVLVEIKTEDLNKEDIQRYLENIRVDIMLLTSTFRAYKEEKGAVDFAELKGLEINKISSPELAKNALAVASIEEMFESNYKDYPGDFKKSLISGFHEILKNPNTDWYLLKREGKIIASARFDIIKLPNGNISHLYFGSVNNNHNFAGGRLGEAMIEQIIRQESVKGYKIEADCNPEAPISKKYLEIGFVADSFYKYNNVDSFHINLDSRRNVKLETKKMSQDTLMALEPLGELVERGVWVTTTLQHPDFSPLKHGYILSRYFSRNNKTYCVFERMPGVERAGLAEVPSELAA